MSNKFYSHLLIGEFSDSVKREIEHYFFSNNLDKNIEIKWFNYKSMVLEDSKNILQEAYLFISAKKVIVVFAEKINHIVQNSLLKIFEEPPLNTIFILVVPSKTILLPTILSRLPIRKILQTQVIKNNISVDINILNFKDLSLVNLNLFLKNIETKKIDQTESVLVLTNILNNNWNYFFNEEDLERFRIAFHLLSLNSNVQRVFLMLLLPFAEKNIK
jgi:DNA polymerase-3 subunit delta'